MSIHMSFVKRLPIALVSVLAGTGLVAAEWEFSGSTVRHPAAEVQVVGGGEFDSRLPSEVVIFNFRFTSFPPTGMILVIR